MIEIWVAVAVPITSLAPRGAAIRKPEARLPVVANVCSISAPSRYDQHHNQFRMNSKQVGVSSNREHSSTYYF